MARSRTPSLARERLFVQHFLAGKPGIRGNATQAYIGAGYAPKAATSCASRLLTRASVQRRIEAQLARNDITADRVIEESRRVAFSDLREFAEWGPDGVKLKPGAEHVGESSRTLRFKLHDKIAALTPLAKHLRPLRETEAPPAVAIFPRGFFAAFITGDLSKMEGGRS